LWDSTDPGDGNYSNALCLTYNTGEAFLADGPEETVRNYGFSIRCMRNAPLMMPRLDDFGTLVFTVPYSDPSVTQTQTYLEDYNSLTGNTDPVSGVTISFLAVGKSRIDELRYYGESLIYSGITTGTTSAGNYTGYTLDGLFYMDYADGYTHITGNTNDFTVEEVYNGMITRNEHLIGFIDEPQIYSDIFIERGKQGIMERNLRLGEIDSTGELDIYGSGYFKVRKQ
jgi:hypothetical protein